MGCCCSKKHLTKKKAFPQELGTPLLDTLVPQLGKNARVVVASLTSLKHVESPEGLPANAFIRIRLAAADEVGGVQEQSSSINPGTHNPRWEPSERFQFIVSDMKKGKLLLSVYHYDESKPKENLPIGDAVIKLDSLDLHELAELKNFPLISPKDGQHQGQATLSMCVLLPKDAQSIIEDTVYEYQEWGLLSDWAALAHPGRWSTADGQKFTEELEQAGQPVPEGWSVAVTWSIMSTQFDPDGWQYTTALDSPFWHFENNNSLFVVRRRAWKRELHKGAKSTKSGESHKTANSVPAAKTPPAPAPAAAAPAANQK